ncbi:hypothetical protein RN001_003706 [Aquatica leii]|uniref:MADF domain-containing protein n=1 Tax=Aquatica leii TaxID=1421715 RepID=A0AAN7QBW5_9COLE|nr:hypothetical protein RN001_003706 [Aquatica leii]
MDDEVLDTELVEEEENAKEVMQQFIELYETLPESWNSKSTYMNKTKRNQALDKLLVIYKKINKNAKRKIFEKFIPFRPNFQRESKKVLSSKRSGAGAEDVYKLTAWTFYALRFLTNNETPTTCYESSDKISSDGTNIEPEVNDAGNKQPFPSQEMPTHSRSSIDPVPPLRIKKSCVVGPLTKQNELLQMACALVESADTPQNNVPSIALAWIEKLLTLEPQQKNFAEKLLMTYSSKLL